MISPDGIVEVFGARVPPGLVDTWKQAGKDHLIGLVELYAVVVARSTWKKFLDDRRVIFFQDNYGVLDVMIKGNAADKAWRTLMLVYENLDADAPSMAWYTRVPSASNIADGPSRARSVRAMLPKEKQEWSLERLHLCQEPPCLAAISFAFASDAITINAHHELERIAAILLKHPGLRLSIVGMARPDAPPELGLALSQARAVRVRSHLLGLLSSCQAWQEEEAMDCGVRAGGYDEGEEIEDALAFYSCQRWVGDRIRAIGRWERRRNAATLCYSTGQCAKIDVAGFD
eukprot:s3895_g3.t1